MKGAHGTGLDWEWNFPRLFYLLSQSLELSESLAERGPKSNVLSWPVLLSQSNSTKEVGTAILITVVNV